MGGKYKPYPEYRDSGINDFPAIPKHWIIGRAKYVTDNFDKFRIPLSAEERGSKQGEYPYYGASGIIDHVDDYLFEGETILYGEDGANLLARSTPLAFLADGKYWVNNHVHILRAKDQLNRYWVRSLNNIDITPPVSGSAQPKFTAETLGNLSVVYPPNVIERVQIANFLDHETAKIDTLIEEQQSLIRLLKEKRQAVISHAVTKGLNPNAPMKDSGVEWLGEVPEHWTVTRAKFLFDSVTSGSRGWAEYYSEDGSLFFRIANLTGDTIEPKLESIQNVNPSIGSEGERSQIKNEDLLISITADLGSVCVADNSVSGGYVSQHVALCRTGQKVANSRWLAYFVLSDCAKEQLLGSGYGGTKIQLSLEDIRELWIVQPPEDEQIDVTQFVDKQMDRYSELSREAENQIQFLQERRTALISAAVTGKIDVRDWQPATEQQEHPAEAIA